MSERWRLFQQLLQKDLSSESDFEQLRTLCFYGIPDSPKGLRPACWKLLLGYTPTDAYLQLKRKEYYTLVKELVVDPGQKGQETDHPLNEEKSSAWQSYFNDVMVLEQIDKDVRRTLPDFAFFQEYIPDCVYNESHMKALFNSQEEAEKSVFDTLMAGPTSRRSLFDRLSHLYHDDDFGMRKRSLPLLQAKQGRELHWEIIERILFMYAKLNPGVGYVQGMNEVLGPLYYVLAHDDKESHVAHAEADAFFTFSALMSEFRDHFIKSMDHLQETSPNANEKPIVLRKPSGMDGNHGIGNSMLRMMRKLKKNDRELYEDLKAKKLHAAHYSFRWLTVLLTQEFSLPDVIRLWDSILADVAIDKRGVQERLGKFDFLLNVCCAMLICVRSEILAGSFADNMKLLQHYPIQDVNEILKVAVALQENTFKLPAPLDDKIDQELDDMKKQVEQKAKALVGVVGQFVKLGISNAAQVASQAGQALGDRRMAPLSVSTETQTPESEAKTKSAGLLSDRLTSWGSTLSKNWATGSSWISSNVLTKPNEEKLPKSAPADLSQSNPTIPYVPVGLSEIGKRVKEGSAKVFEGLNTTLLGEKEEKEEVLFSVSNEELFGKEED